MSDIACGQQRQTHAGVRDRAMRLATIMQRCGIGREDVVALLTRNRIEAIEVHLAARMLDAIVVPLNWHSTSSEAAFILADCAPRLLIGEGDLISASYDGIPASLKIIVFDENYKADIASAAPCEYVCSGLGSSLIYTSGTSGKPKGIRRLSSNPAEAEHRLAVLREVYDAQPENRALTTGPLYHLFSLATAMSNFAAGGSVTIMPRFDAEEVLRLIERDRITHTSFVPTMMVRLLRLPDAVKARYDYTSLRHVVQSGAPCAKAIKRAMIDWLGPIFHETYGSTETGVMTMIGSQDWLDRPGSVGKPVSTGEVGIYDEKGLPLPAGETGDIYMRMHGTPDFTYVGDPARRAVMERNGLITVGDMGWLDADGYLYICDRRGDMAIVGGINIYPAEVEDALLAHPSIVDAAVFGIPDDDYGERLVAHVSPTEGTDINEADVRAHLADRLMKAKWPSVIVIDADLPRAENGKILKRVLRERYRIGATA